MWPADRSLSLVETPWDRFKEVTFDLFTDKTLPNILLGAFLTALMQYAIGMVPLVFPVVAGVFWQGSVLLYAIFDEIKRQIEERKARLLDPDDAPRGIE